MVSTASRLYFVYEAGPCGYGLYRHLAAKGFNSMVAAPSLISQRSGDRIKTDRRHAVKLAQLHHAGELTAVYVPNPQDEAMRDLRRARNDTINAPQKTKQRLKALLLRNRIVYSGRFI